MRTLALVLLTFALVAAAPLAGATGQPAPGGNATAAQPFPFDVGAVGANALLAFPQYADDPRAAHLLMFAQLEQQGLLQPGTLRALAQAADGPRPVEHVYRDAHPTCDLDGDGVRDLISNDIEFNGAPSQASGYTQMRAYSGATGELLWVNDEQQYSRIQSRAGAAYPGGPVNYEEAGDIDGDGACDVLTYSLRNVGGDISVPILNDPSVSFSALAVGLVSGADGSVLWEDVIDNVRATGGDPLLRSARATVSTNMPTGFMAYEAAEGARVAVKLTDTNFTRVQPPVFISLGSIFEQFYGGPIFRGPLFYESMTVTEKIRVYDAATGAQLWEAPLGGESEGRFTNITWFGGVSDMTGDGEPEIILDQLSVTNPRGTEAYQPFGGPPLFEYGRGAGIVSLDGATGALRWRVPVLDPLAIDANPPQEESKELLAFTWSQALPDIDGDGMEDALAAYVAQEVNLQSTVEGSYRTHFIPVSGANGSMLWDVRHQGWGFLTPMDPEPTTRLAVGMVDIPTDLGGGRFPPKFVRLLALDVADGSAKWSYERAYSQNSYLSYNHALKQFGEALAPHDWDGDGLRDIVTPSQYNAATGRDQVLLSTSTHTYEVLSGDDGASLATMRAWGPDGRVVACDGAEDKITVATGHARRFDLTRFDPVSERLEWRVPMWNDAAPRAATTAVDLSGVGIRCGDQPDLGRTTFSANLYEFSYARRHEIIAIRGSIDAATTSAAWVEPAVRGSPPTDMRLTAAPSDDELAAQARVSWVSLGIAAALGVAAAILTLLVLKRLPVVKRLLGVALVLMLLTPTVLGGVALPAAPAFDAPVRDDAPATVRDAAPPPQASDVERVAAAVAAQGGDLVPAHLTLAVASYLASMGVPVPPTPPDNKTAPGFTDNSSFSYTRELPDMDGDGVEDVLLQQYCTNYRVCDDTPPLIQDPTGFMRYICDVPHHVYLVSGKTSEPVWHVDLSMMATVMECGIGALMGIVPLDDGRTGILLYKHHTVGSFFGATFVGQFAIFHEITMLDAATGEAIWTIEHQGHVEQGWLATASAQDFIVLPIPQTPPPDGERGTPRGVETTIFLQGIGFIANAAQDLGLVAFTRGLGGPIGSTILLLDQYEPVEWAARIDVQTGAELWRVDTFQPSPPRSVLPRVTGFVMEAYYFHDGAGDRYWTDHPCCSDMTGDGVPDLLYRVYEWSSLPNANIEGPYLLNSRVVVRDGATGALTFDEYISTDIRTPLQSRSYPAPTIFHAVAQVPRYDLAVAAVGDVNGDGAVDIVTEEEFYDYDYMHVLSVRSGLDATELWRVESPRDLRVIPAGDADEDGAPDLLLVDWYGYEGGAMFYDDYAQPGATPLRMVSGATGAELWRATSYQAPSDVVLYYDTLLRNGAPDVTGDGVADVVVDDPQYLDDQTVIHRNRVLDGKTGDELYVVETVGAFSVPARVEDVTGNGRDDLIFLSGDLNDLWMTLVDGDDGSAQWSRRLAALPTSSYAFALPKLKYHVLHDENATTPQLLVNMHLELVSMTIYYGIFVGNGGASTSESIAFSQFLRPQLLQVDGRRGEVSWSLPAVSALAAEGLVIGATPGTKAFSHLLQTAQASAVDEAKAAAPRAVPVALVFIVAYAAVLAVGVVVMRARARDAEVPDLA